MWLGLIGHACREVSAWGGPGEGTVGNITGRTWRPYMQSADHPECAPSLSHACINPMHDASLAVSVMLHTPLH